MPRLDNISPKHFMLLDGRLVWDGITKPETNKDGKPQWTLSAVFLPGNADITLLYQYATECVAQSTELGGVFPQGGVWAYQNITDEKFGPEYVGGFKVNFKSNALPDIYDENNTLLTDSMQYAQSLYPGQSVDIMGHCYAYNNVQKGVSCGVDGFRINVSRNMPRFDIGSRVNTANAFVPGTAPVTTAQPVATTAPAAPGVPVTTAQPVATTQPAPPQGQPNAAGAAPAQGNLMPPPPTTAQ